MAGQKKILFVNYSLGVGGIETLILEMCRRLDKEKFKLAVCAFEKAGRLESEFQELRVDVFIKEKSAGTDFRLPFKIASLIKKEKIDIVHTHNQTAWLYGGIAALMAGVKLVHTEHTTADYHNYHTQRWIVIEKMLSVITHRITAVAGSVRDFMAAKSGISPAKLEVVYNGIKADTFDLEMDIEEKKKELGFSKDDMLVGNVARLFEPKNHKGLISAFKKVAEHFPKAYLLIAGDGPLRDALQKRIAEEGLDNNVRLLGNRRDIPEFLNALDVFILPSFREGLPIVLLEAMAAGLPVIASNVDGNTELVVDGQTGLIICPDDIEGMSNALIRILSDKALAEDMAKKGKKRVVSDFSFEQMTKKYENIYRSVLDEALAK